MHLVDIARIFILKYGLISVFFILMLEYLSIPLPSEIILPLIGALASNNNQNFILILIVSLIGGAVGSIIMYTLGRYFGNNAVSFIEKRIPKTKKSINRAKEWLNKYKVFAVFLSRVVPFARTFISLTSGIIKMNPVLFLTFSTIGMAIWNSILLGLGFVFGDNKKLINIIVGRFSDVIIVILATILVIAIIKNRKVIKKKFL